MIAAFFHDAPLVKDKLGGIHSIGFTYNVWERYLKVFEHLIVSTRIRYDDEIAKKLRLSSGDGVTFRPITKYCSPKDRIFNKNEITKQIRETLCECDCAIIRLPSFIGNIACKEAIKMNKPYLIEAVACAWDSYFNHSLMGKSVAYIEYITMKNNVKNALYVIYVSEKFLQKRYPCKNNSISCSDVLLPNIDMNILDERIKKIKNIETNKRFILGTIAAVDVKYKGHEYVIKAISHLNNIGYNFEYHLVGAGNQSRIRNIAEKYEVIDRVKFIGPISHDRIFNFVQGIDIYIQPSDAESHGRAIIEAMSCACPVIGSSTGGIPELISEEFVFKRKDINNLENKIMKMGKEEMLNEAVRNFNKAQLFQKDLLDKKRKDFLIKFINAFK